jgi:hypothetical protein
VEEIRKLGPLNWGNFQKDEGEGMKDELPSLEKEAVL